LKKLKNSEGYAIIRKWMDGHGMEPFGFQEKTWEKFEQGYSGMVVAPTGFGKTYSVFIAVLIHFFNHHKQYKKGLKLMWVTPLRSLAKDIARAMSEVVEELGMDWVVGVRNGDTSTSVRQKQAKLMPDILVITPESLQLLLSQKEHSRFFKSLQCIAVDEWHELLGSKRGVLTELCISSLRRIQPGMRTWGITATIGNLEEAMQVLIPGEVLKTQIVAKEKKGLDIISLMPDEVEVLPWAGHMGSKMVDKIIPVIFESRSTLIFTNTRGQSEVWFSLILDRCPELAGQIAIHHGSIDGELRAWIEDHLSSGYLKAVVCTSSLDLGVDFKPVDTVIQIGSPKGVARFLQRAGRSGHSPFERSRIYFVPTHSLELIESAALQEAIKQNVIEERRPLVQTFDVLIQFMVSMALGDGFRQEELYPQIKGTHAFQFMNDEEWQWMLQFITYGGQVLKSYDEYHKVVLEEGVYKVKSRRIAMLHRMNSGVITSDAMIRVKFISGGHIGMIEEYFISRLKPGDHFILAGRVLEFVMIKDMMVLVRRSKSKKAIAPSWLGGRLPLSSNLSHFLRIKLSDALQNKSRQKELAFLHPLLSRQEKHSHIPKEDELLVELIQTREGYHLFIYPFEGRLLHEIMSALIAFRISKITPISFSIAMNDYGFELLSDQPIPINEQNIGTLLSADHLMQDVISSINSAEMASRKFRDIARIAGLVIQNYPGQQRSGKNLQSSSSLIFKVLEDHDPQNLLLKQAYEEVFHQQVEDERLQAAFKRINNSRIVMVHAKSFTPLSFPIKVDSMRQALSSEDLESRIRKIQDEVYKKTRADD
jgi:ATP-dependent Lhr-like helicase